MNRYLSDVKDFHEKFGLSYDGKPRSIPNHMAEFRERFAREEAEETAGCNYIANTAIEVEAFQAYQENLAGVLDGLVDQLYVLMGTLYLHGMGHVFDEAWDRVHAANMKKVRATEASQSKRSSTLDVVKPEGWEPPTLLDLVEGHDLA